MSSFCNLIYLKYELRVPQLLNPTLSHDLSQIVLQERTDMGS